MSLPNLRAEGNISVHSQSGAIELKESQSGTKYAHFTLCCNQSRKNPSSGQYETVKTVYLDCTCFGRIAEMAASSLHKGTRVTVEGQLDEPGVWTPKNGGDPKAQLHVILRSFGVIPTGQSNQQGGYRKPPASQQTSQPQPSQQQWQQPEADPWGGTPFGEPDF